jgi:hypothetical protein
LRLPRKRKKEMCGYSSLTEKVTKNKGNISDSNEKGKKHTNARS